MALSSHGAATKLGRDESVHSTLSKLFKKNKALGTEIHQPKITLKRSSKQNVAAEKDQVARPKANNPVTVILLGSNCFTT